MAHRDLSMLQGKSNILFMERGMGVTIRAARTARGMRIQDLADAIGKAPSYVSKIETGAMKEMLAPSDLNAIARVLDLDVADLLRTAGYNLPAGDSETPEPPPHMRASFLRAGKITPEKQEVLNRMIDIWYEEDQRYVDQMEKDRQRRISDGVEEGP